jgi:GDP-4-dehydro-6-deoxy-D-mannose reductase
MRVLITGVGGFVGRRLAAYLVARGAEVIGTTFEVGGHEPRPDLPGVELVPLDVADRQAVATLVASLAPEAVVHLAGLSHVGESWQRVADYYTANVLGTENVAAACSGRRLLLASSAEVYGSVPEAEQPIVEDRALRPGNPYALTKAVSERLALQVGAVVVRCFNLIGPGQGAKFALPAFAEQLAAMRAGRQEPVLRVGNLGARRDFVHVDDACAAFALLLERGEAGGVYNLARGESTSLAAAVGELCRVAGLEVRIEIDPARLRPLDLPVMSGDASRLRALGWVPKASLTDALRDLWLATVAAVEGIPA